MKKIIILIMFTILLSSFVSAFEEYDTNIILYYTLDNDNISSSNPLDITPNGNDGISYNGVTTGATGKINEGFSFDGIDDEVYIGTSVLATANELTISMWFYANTITTSDMLSGRWGGGEQFMLRFDSSNRIEAYIKGDSATIGPITTGVVSTGTWNHIVLTYDNSNGLDLYLNEILSSGGSGGDLFSTSNHMTLGYYYGGGVPTNHFDGTIDEFLISDKRTNSDNVSFLYNSGLPTEYQQFPFIISNIAPNITISTPINNDHLNDDPVLIIYNITDSDDDLINCTIQLNGSNQTTTTNINTTTNDIQYYNLTTTEGSKNVTIICTDGIAQTQDTTLFVIDRTNPDWTIRTINTDNTSIIDRSTIDYIYFNDSVDDNYLFAYNITAYYPNSTIWFTNQTIDLNITNFDYIWNKSIETTQPNGTYNIIYSATDDHTAKEIPEYYNEVLSDGLRFSFDNYYIDVKSDNPQTLQDLSTTKLLDRYTFDFNYKTPKNTRIYSVISDEKIYYRGNLYEYPVFVIGGNWVDFNLPEDVGTTYKILKKSDYWYQIEINKINPSTNDNIKSLGGLNIQTESYTFQIKANSPPNITGTSPSQNISISENTTINFVTNATDFDNDTIYYYYYLDGILNYTGQNASIYFGFNTNGTHILLVNATDGGKQDTYTWNINITNVNLPPIVNSLVRSPLTTWYSNIENTKFVCDGTDQDNETQSNNWNVEIEYRTATLWTGLIPEYYALNQWSANISISALEGETLDARCRISDGIDFSDWYQVNSIVSIQQAYSSMSIPNKINPTDKSSDYVTSVTCTPGTYGSIRSYKLIYDIDYKYNNTWYNLSLDKTSKALFDMAKINYGENVTFRCRISDGINTTNFLTGEAVTREHTTNLFMFGKGGDEVKLSKRPYTKGIIADFYNEANITIIGTYADCDGNGYWDYYNEYNTTKNFTQETFTCVNIKGVIKHTIGVLINKTGSNNKVCGTKSSGYCKIERTYDVVIK